MWESRIHRIVSIKDTEMNSMCSSLDLSIQNIPLLNMRSRGGDAAGCEIKTNIFQPYWKIILTDFLTRALGSDALSFILSCSLII